MYKIIKTKTELPTYISGTSTAGNDTFIERSSYHRLRVDPTTQQASLQELIDPSDMGVLQNRHVKRRVEYP